MSRLQRFRRETPAQRNYGLTSRSRRSSNRRKRLPLDAEGELQSCILSRGSAFERGSSATVRSTLIASEMSLLRFLGRHKANGQQNLAQAAFASLRRALVYGLASPTANNSRGLTIATWNQVICR